jgi:L-alanine-DL-glutamate epimerase-like enolase superfamily enzyme
MKITDVKAIPMKIPQKLNYTPPVKGFNTESDGHVLVKIFTDEGIVGFGEAWRLTIRAVSTFIEEALKPRLIGEDPRRIEKLWYKMYVDTFRYGRKGLVLNSISGVEIALWDILGKLYGVPVYQLLGGAYWDSIRAYASLPPYAYPEEVSRDAAIFVKEGYHLIKLHQRDLESIEKTRQAIGIDAELALDVNGYWTPQEAVAMVNQMKAFNIRWLEEPVYPMDDYNGLRYVREHSNILIAAGENEYTHYGFKTILEKHPVDLLQPDVTKCGGLLCCRKILAMAESWNYQLIPHSFYYGPGVAATAHFVMANPLSNEMEINSIPLTMDYITPNFRPEKGKINVSNKPGLGIEIKEEVVEKYRIDQ